MAKSVLFEGTTGGTIKDTDVMAYKEEGVVSGDPKRLHLFSAMKTYFQGLLPGKVSDIESSMGSIEYPTIGEAIDPDIDELFFDGVNSTGITSDGRVPTVYSSDHEPAIISVDGSEIANPLVKFPNRGVEGFFAEYTNEVDELDINVASITQENDGSWTKLTAIADDVSSYIRYNLPINPDGFIYIELRQGVAVDATPTPRVQVVSDSVGVLNCSVNWATKTVTFSVLGDGVFTTNSFLFVDDDTVVIKMGGTFASVTTTQLRVYVNSNTLETTAGDTVYYRNPMAVQGISYPVPYVKDTHLPTYGEYYFDWAKYENWTIEGWINVDNTTPDNNPCFLDNRFDNFDNPGFFMYRTINATEIKIGAYGDSLTQNSIRIIEDGSSGYHHFKLVYQSGVSIECYGDGILKGTLVILPTNSNIAKQLFVGKRYDGLSVNSYIADFVIKPYIDSSTDHYTSGLPYYNPDTTYGKNGSFSISKDGTVKTNNLMSNGRRVPTISSGESFPTYNVGLGDECYRTDLDEFYKYNGTVWLQI